MNAIKNYIDDNKISITTFAKRVGLPVPTIWRYVNDKFTPSPKHAKRIYEKTGIPLWDILFPPENEGK